MTYSNIQITIIQGHKFKITYHRFIVKIVSLGLPDPKYLTYPTGKSLHHSRMRMIDTIFVYIIKL